MEKIEIKASTIIATLMKGGSLKTFFEKIEKGNYLFENYTIKENLDLTDLTVTLPFRFKNCVFENEVKFVYTTFKGAVEIENCTFEKKVNCGDGEQAHTVFEKSANFKNCIFKEEFSFCGAICEGMGDFDGSKFYKKADFLCARFNRSVFFQNVLFHDCASFKSMKVQCRAMFENSIFESNSKVINFIGSSYGEKLECNQIVSNSPMSFSAITAGCIDFKCATLNNEIHFRNINCNKFNCNETFFNKRTDFEQAIIRENFKANKTKFHGETIFNALHVDGDILLNKSYFKEGGLASFKYCICKGNLEFSKTEFYCVVNLESTQINSSLNLNDTKISERFSLKNVSTNQFVFNCILMTDGILDLRGFKFNIIKKSDFYDDTIDIQDCLEIFNKKQIKKKFSRDPYIQLEHFYRSRGQIKFADEVYYTGRSQLGKYALIKNSGINMSKFEIFSDWILKYLTGYGTKNTRILGVILAIIICGGFVFYSADVAPKAPATNKATYYAAYATDMFMPVELGISKDNFLPISKNNDCGCSDNGINTPSTKESDERCISMEIFCAIYVLLGWLLIPLAVLSITGFLTNKDK